MTCGVAIRYLCSFGITHRWYFAGAQIGRLNGFVYPEKMTNCVFRSNPATDSGPIPATHSGENRPPFRSIPATPDGGLSRSC